MSRVIPGPSVKASPQRLIGFRVKGQFLRAYGIPFDLAKALRCPVSRIDPRDTTRAAFTRRTTQRMARPLGHGQFESLPGFFPQILDILRHRGYETDGLEIEPPTERTLTPVGYRGTPNPSLRELIRTAERGMIYYDDSSVRLIDLLDETTRVFDEYRIMIVATRVSDAQRIMNEFESRKRSDVSCRISNRRSGGYSRVHVTTSRAANEQSDMDPAMILHVNPDEQAIALPKMGLKGNHRRHGLLFNFPCALFGFLPLNRQVPPNRRVWLTGSFGPREVTIWAPGRVRVVPSVTTVPIQTTWRADVSDRVEVLNEGIYRHAIRNRLIVRIARIAETGEWPDPRTLPDSLVSTVFRSCWNRIAVLTDHVGHAAALSEQLSWPIVSACQPSETQRWRRVEDQFQLGGEFGKHYRCVIALPGGLAAAGCFDLLIRADGGLDLPALAIEQLTDVPSPSGLLRRPLLIDFDDRHHPWLRYRAHDRARAYRADAWPTTASIEAINEEIGEGKS